MIEITERRHCFEITAVTDNNIEPRYFVTLELHTNDVAVNDTDTTTIVLSDNRMLPCLLTLCNFSRMSCAGGHGSDKLLRYHYGYPQVHPLCVIAYFQVQHDLKLEKCKLKVGGTYRERNCMSLVGSELSDMKIYIITGSDGYIAFYFEHFGDDRPHTLIIEGDLEEQREPYMLTTVFHLRKNMLICNIILLSPFFTATLTTCWVYLINDGISVYENSIFVEWSGTGALNYRSDTFSYLCRIDIEAQQPCMFLW